MIRKVLLQEQKKKYSSVFKAANCIHCLMFFKLNHCHFCVP